MRKDSQAHVRKHIKPSAGKEIWRISFSQRKAVRLTGNTILKVQTKPLALCTEVWPASRNSPVPRCPGASSSASHGHVGEEMMTSCSDEPLHPDSSDGDVTVLCG